MGTSTPNTGVSRQVFLGEEEISEVSLATFYVFDTENVGSRRAWSSARQRWWRLRRLWWRWLQRLRRLRRWLRSWLRRRLQKSASALEVAVVVAAQGAAWAGGVSTV